jgi:hypothetical protein
MSTLIGKMARHSVLRPAAWELWGLAAVTSLYLLTGLLYEQEGCFVANLVGPVALVILLGLGALRMTRAERSAIWACLFTFRVSSAIYFGLGSLVPYVANSATWLNLHAYSYFDDVDMMKFNLIVAVSILTVLATCTAFDAVRPYRYDLQPIGAGAGGGRRLLISSICFYVPGAVVQYFVLLPHYMGWTTDVLAGALGSLGSLMLIGIFLFTSWSITYAPAMFPVAASVVGLECTVGMLLFNKTEIILPIIMLLLAIFTRGVTLVRMGAVFVALVIIFAFIQPLVSYGRTKLSQDYGGVTGGGLIERLEIVESYFTVGVTRTGTEETQESMLRISYISIGTAVINAYDRGQPGNTLEDILTVFIPRFLWAEKPIITRGGEELATMQSGEEGNSVSAGFFAEAYWNFGWFGIPLLMIPLGVILTMLSRFTLNVFRREAWIYMPAVFLAFRIGGRVDGLYVADVAGAGALVLAMVFIFGVIERVIAHRPVQPALGWHLGARKW